MADLVAVDVATDLGHLEPFQVPQAVRGRADGVANGVVEGVGRGAVDLGDGIDVARHGCPFLIFLLSTGSCQIGRASCRERVCQYVWIWVVALELKKKKRRYFR